MLARGMELLHHALVRFEPVTAFPENVIGDVRRDYCLDVQPRAVGVRSRYKARYMRRDYLVRHVHCRSTGAAEPMIRCLVDVCVALVDAAEQELGEIGRGDWDWGHSVDTVLIIGPIKNPPRAERVLWLNLRLKQPELGFSSSRRPSPSSSRRPPCARR